MPAHKKHPDTRRRRNKASTAATLTSVPDQQPTPLRDYSTWTVAKLRDEVDGRNQERPASQQIPKPRLKAQLVEALTKSDAPIPSLPDLGKPWSPMVLEWWDDVWSSPMEKEWHDSDRHNVVVCAMLLQDMFTATTAGARQKAASEFRLQRAALGLTPLDRRRLEWTIETAKDAQEKGKRRGTFQAKSGEKPTQKTDPRASLALA